jgi:hypothetical protein
MTVNIVTNEDLQNFRKELVTELTALISSRPAMPVKWMKTYQVREILSISAGTLQTLRINGTLAYSKIGGCIYYNYDDIVKMMEKDKKNVKGSSRRSQ